MVKLKYPRVLFELRPSRVHKGGVGVFAVAPIAKGTVVAAGYDKNDLKRIIPWAKLRNFDKKFREKALSHCIGTPYGFIPPPQKDFNGITLGWHFNHDCNGDLGFDRHGNYVAIRKIRKDEELTFDYGLYETNPKFRLACSCGKNCRKLVTGDDWKKLLLDKEKAKYVFPYIQAFAIYQGK
jgi:hypothetical protein